MVFARRNCNIDEIGLDEDNDEVLGATSAEGMPLTLNDALIQCVRKKTVEGLSLRPDSPGQGEVGEVDDEDVEVNDDEFDGEKRSDAFGGIIAPEGYVYTGKLVFICFGPTSKYFAGTLMGGQADRTVEEKKEGSRKAQCKVTINHNNVDREVGFDRVLTMQSKMQCAMMAKNEDDAEQHHCDMRLMIIMKQIKSTERLVDKIENL